MKELTRQRAGQRKQLLQIAEAKRAAQRAEKERRKKEQQQNKEKEES